MYYFDIRKMFGLIFLYVNMINSSIKLQQYAWIILKVVICDFKQFDCMLWC